MRNEGSDVNKSKRSYLYGKIGERLVKSLLDLNGYKTYKALDFFNLYYRGKYIHSKPDLGVDFISINHDKRTIILSQSKSSGGPYRRLSKREMDKFLSAGKYYEKIIGNDYDVYYVLFTRGDINDSIKSYVMRSGIDKFVVVDTNSLYQEGVGLKAKLLDKDTGEFVDCDLFKKVSVLKKNGVSLEKAYEIKNLFHHQQAAIDFVLNNMKAGYNRFTLAMATGTGKTLTYIRLMMKMIKNKDFDNFIIFSPSVSLIAQILESVAYELKAHGMYQDFDILCVTHDKTVYDDPYDNIDLEEFININMITNTSVTTDVSRIEKFITSSEKRKKIIISTYQSVENVKMAIDNAKAKVPLFYFDLGIMDEAHWTAGYNKDKVKKAHLVHHDDYIPIRVRVYCTGTLSVYQSKFSKSIEDKVIYSMDNPDIYGLVYRYPLRQAIVDGILTDYRIVVFYTILYNQYEYGEWREVVLKSKADIEYEFMSLLTIIDALKNGIDTDLSHEREVINKRNGILTVNSRIKAKEIKNAFDNLKDKLGYNDVEVDYILGDEKQSDREKKIEWLREEEPGKIKIMLNVRVLNEGIDIPNLGFVGFLERKSSVIDILQILGRVLRKSEGKEKAYVFVPLLISINEEDYTKQLTLNEDVYGNLIDILDAARSQDNFEYVRDRVVHARNLSDRIYSTKVLNNHDYNKIREKIDKAIRVSENKVINTMHYKTVRLNKTIVRGISNRINDLFQNFKNDIKRRMNNNPDFNNKINELKEHIRDIKNKYNIQAFTSDNDENNQIINLMCLNLIVPEIFKHYINLEEDNIYKSINDMLDYFLGDYIGYYREKVSFHMQYINDQIKNLTNEMDKINILKDLFESLFNTLFKDEMRTLGAVYTPIEAVEFMVYSTKHLIETYFNKSVLDNDVIFVDYFAGTGTIIAAVMDMLYNEAIKSGYDKEVLAKKIEEYKVFGIEIHYLAYLIFKSIVTMKYKMLFNRFPSKDIAMLGDTFKTQKSQIIGEGLSHLFSYNKEINNKIQLILSNHDLIRVVIMNPPYGNMKGKELTLAVSEELSQYEVVGADKKLSNRYLVSIVNEIMITNRGVITAIIPNDFLYSTYGRIFKNYLEKNPKVKLVKVLNLRGDAKQSGDKRKKEGDSIFGSSSKLGNVIISIVIDKNISENYDKKIYYYQVNDYMSRNEKLEFLKEKTKTMDVKYLQIYAKDGVWITDKIVDETFIKNREYYENKMYDILPEGRKGKQQNVKNNGSIFKEGYLGFISGNDKEKLKNYSYNKDINEVECVYRPFYKKIINVYQFENFNAIYRQNKDVFPIIQDFVRENKVILIGDLTEVFCTDKYYDSGSSSHKNQSLGIPLYIHHETHPSDTLFKDTEDWEYNINDDTMIDIYEMYKVNIKPEDVFYYVIGYLNNPEYKERFGDFVVSNKPKVGFVKDVEKFYRIVNIGKVIYNMLVNFESVKEYDLDIEIKSDPNDINTYLLSDKVKIDNKNGIIYYNQYITIKVPLEAFKYELRDRNVYKNLLNSDSVENMNEVIRNTEPDYFIKMIKKVTTIAIEMNRIRERLREMRVFDEIE